MKPTFEDCTPVVLDSMKLLTTAHVLTVNQRSKFSLLRKRTRLPTHVHKVRALTFEVTDNFGSNVVLPYGAYGPISGDTKLESRGDSVIVRETFSW